MLDTPLPGEKTGDVHDNAGVKSPTHVDGDVNFVQTRMTHVSCVAEHHFRKKCAQCTRLRLHQTSDSRALVPQMVRIILSFWQGIWTVRLALTVGTSQHGN